MNTNILTLNFTQQPSGFFLIPLPICYLSASIRAIALLENQWVLVMTDKRRARITLGVVKSLKAGEEVRCTELPGFGVRLQSNIGQPSYFVHRRMKGGAPVKVTIGPHGTWTPKTARDKAVKICALLADGINPNALRKEQRGNPSVAEAVERFFEEHGPKLKKKTVYDYRSLFRRLIVPAIGHRKLRDVARADIVRLHSKMKDTPRQANFALAALSKLMSWAENVGLRDENSNPVKGVQRYKERAKERYLKLEELKRLGQVLDQAMNDNSENPFVVWALRLLILTGARRSEILSLRWEYVDLSSAVLRLPDSKTGAKLIRLSPPAIDALERILRVTGNPHVIVGHRPGGHLVNLSKPWKRVCTRAGIQGVRIHDLRHSFASTLASSGASLPVIGALLGHTQAQTTQRYAHLLDDPLRKANDAAASSIAGAMMAFEAAPPREA